MNRTIRHLKLITLACIAALSLSTCQDFFGTADLKAIIKDDVETATAESVNVTLKASSDNMGVPSPYGLQTFKVGTEYSITTTVGSDYAFKAWTHDGASGDITFSNPDSVSTKMTINRNVSGLSIIPTFDARPYVISMRPHPYETDVINTTPIQITFSEPIDMSTANFDNIDIRRRQNGSLTDPISETDRFESPTLSGSVLTIRLKSGEVLGSTDSKQEIFVIINKNVADTSGNTMRDTYRPDAFITSTEGDINPPTIDGSIAVKTSVGIPITLSGHPTPSRSIKIDFDAADTESSVLYVLVTDDLGTTLYDDSYARNIDITLPDVEESRTLTVVVSDPSGNDSAPKTVSVLYDHTNPTITTPILGASYYGTPLAVSGTANDPGATSSSIQRAQYSFDGTTWADMTGTTSWSGNLALSSPEGVKTLYLRSQDNAGNYSSQESVGFTYDSSIPDLTETGIGSETTATKKAAFSLTGGASDTNAFASVVIMAAKDGGAASQVFSKSTSGTYTYSPTVDTATHTTDGLWVYTITATDVVGRTKVLTRNVLIDTTAPTVTMPTLGAAYYETPLSASGTASDPTTYSTNTSGLSLLEYSIDGSTWTNFTTTATSWTQSVTLSGAQGVRTLSVRATD
ncbi:MAG TPA: Ig-like domain-containing protein, partial [bacterium]|nr:Ig-like domain-containing protein [bacterium]